MKLKVCVCVCVCVEGGGGGVSGGGRERGMSQCWSCLRSKNKLRAPAGG